jgi:hypothetical protein
MAPFYRRRGGKRVEDGGEVDGDGVDRRGGWEGKMGGGGEYRIDLSIRFTTIHTSDKITPPFTSRVFSFFLASPNHSTP